jgi:hypothetical protein
MQDVVFWDVALCRSCVNRHFGGTYRLIDFTMLPASDLQHRPNPPPPQPLCWFPIWPTLLLTLFSSNIAGYFRLQPPAHAGSSLADFSTLKMEAMRSSETSVNTRPTQRHIPEEILHVWKMYVQIYRKNGKIRTSILTQFTECTCGISGVLDFAHRPVL